jgi:hypothetical protein
MNSTTVTSVSYKDMIIMALLFLVLVPGMIGDAREMKLGFGKNQSDFSFLTAFIHCGLFVASYYVLKTYVFKDSFTNAAKKLVY